MIKQVKMNKEAVRMTILIFILLKRIIHLTMIVAISQKLKERMKLIWNAVRTIILLLTTK